MGRRHKWTFAQIALLGTMPDARVAQQFGLHVSTVKNKRSRLGIAPSRPHTIDRAEVQRVIEAEGVSAARARWSVDVVKPVALKLDVWEGHVRQRYLAAAAARRRNPPWSEEWDSLLHDHTTYELSAKTGVPVSTIQRRRETLGIFAPIRARGASARDLRAREVVAKLTDEELVGPLRALAARVNSSFAMLRRERLRRGLTAAPWHGSKEYDHTRALRVAMQALTDAGYNKSEIARCLRASRQYVNLLAEEVRASREAEARAAQERT